MLIFKYGGWIMEIFREEIGELVMVTLGSCIAAAGMCLSLAIFL